MSAQQFPEAGNPAREHREEMMSALFAHLVMQQSNMAMMLMGKVANPESGRTMKDMEAAKLFIDMLDMLEAKTKGNLSKEEANLLKQTLMSLHLTFVEEVETSPPPSQSKDEKDSSQLKEAATGEPKEPALDPGASSDQDEDHRKKFSKKY
jgi:uncharacterized protein DUF1844